MSLKRKTNSAVEAQGGEEEDSLGRKLLRWMESKGDVIFLVGSEGEQEKIKASTILLSALSPVFDVMFNENWKQQNQPAIWLPDIKPHIFRHFLKLLTSDRVNIEDLTELELNVEEILHMLYVAKKYEAESITSICRVWVHKNITTKDVLFIYTTIQHLDEPELEKEAFEFITNCIRPLMEDESFLDLSEKNLMEIVKYEDLPIPELTLFKGVYRWAESKCALKNVEINGENIRKTLGPVLFLIRFPVLTIQDFFKSVEPTGILTAEEISEIARCIALKGDSSFLNKGRFISKERLGEEKNIPYVYSAPPPLDYSFVYTPTEPVKLKKVVVVDVSSRVCLERQRAGEYSIGFSNRCFLKLRICNEEGDVLVSVADSFPVTDSFQLTNFPFSSKFPKSLRLEKGKRYHVHYDVKTWVHSVCARECQWLHHYNQHNLTLNSGFRIRRGFSVEFSLIPFPPDRPPDLTIDQ